MIVINSQNLHKSGAKRSLRLHLFSVPVFEEIIVINLRRTQCLDRFDHFITFLDCKEVLLSYMKMTGSPFFSDFVNRVREYGPQEAIFGDGKYGTPLRKKPHQLDFQKSVFSAFLRQESRLVKCFVFVIFKSYD